MDVKRILLYSPDVVGHPRVYCRVIADALAGQECKLTVAMGFRPGAELADSPDLLPLAARNNLELVDTRAWSQRGEPHLNANEIVALQRLTKADVTLFIEAEKSSEAFRRIAAGTSGRLLGRNLGIFANTAEWYPGEDAFTGERRALMGPTLRRTLGNIYRAAFHRSRTARHFFENVMLRRKVLDEILVKDERLASWWDGGSIHWMPEISRPAPTPPTPAELDEVQHWEGELDRFLTRNQGREPVLYFGDAAYYKGYDLFLEFLATTPGACGLHPGRTYDAQQRSYFRSDVDSLRAQLKSEGRLLETGVYVHTQAMKELFFRPVRVYLTTHRLALSSSTVIQALEFGKPVLVPDRGLIGWRVTRNGLGKVYRYEDVADLRAQAQAMWKSDLEPWKANGRAFYERFTDDAIAAFFRRRLLG